MPRVADRAGRSAHTCLTCLVVSLLLTSASGRAQDEPSAAPAVVPPFDQLVAQRYGAAEGLTDLDVHAIAAGDGIVLAAAGARVMRLVGGRFEQYHDRRAEVLLGSESYLYVLAGGELLWLRPDAERARSLGRVSAGVTAIAAGSGLPPRFWLGSRRGIETLPQELTQTVAALVGVFEVRDLAERPAAANARELVAVAAAEGLFLLGSAADPQRFVRLLPRASGRSWNPVDVRVVQFDAAGRLWFGSPQGLGVYDFSNGAWRLLEAQDGLPVADFTAAAAAPRDGSVWFGTTQGLVHVRLGAAGAEFSYRQGPRWLPDDLVRDLALDPAGTLWVATRAGIAALRSESLTLGAKAARFERDIARYHRRTEHAFVVGADLVAPGDRTFPRLNSSDNDGLWTALYGAAEAFSWAATRDAGARQRARHAFEALRFLGDVTQGGRHPAPPGFVARSVIPAADPDPNLGTRERDAAMRAERDRRWKKLEPRWPLSADGAWYWKTDTSSDELDGHFFLYATYYDLVAATDGERNEVRAVVRRLLDHLLDHGLALHDHDGTPTRWAVFSPERLNGDPDWWAERGLNSLSILAYLRAGEHITGDPRYAAAARELIERHAYAANVRAPKVHDGPGTGNQSDDQLAFLGFYTLLGYERDPALRAVFAHTFYRYWLHESAERNPLFYVMARARLAGAAYGDAFEHGPVWREDPGWRRDAVDSLSRYPLDRVDWPVRNSHRLDVVRLRGSSPERPRGHLRDGRVLPIDERFVDHWNHDPWALDQGGEGKRLADATSFLLPYYMALHHGVIARDP